MNVASSPPKVSEYMTPVVHVIEPAATLREALDVMEAAGVRHLPVVDKGHPVGILSMSDLCVVESMLAVDTEQYAVADAMATEPYVVSSDTPLGSVARAMAERHIGSALVTEHDALVGIFTATDGLRALSEALSGPRHA